MHGAEGRRIGEARLLVGVFKLLLERNTAAGRDKPCMSSSIMTMDCISLLLVGQVLHGGESRRTSDRLAACIADRSSLGCSKAML